MIPSLKAGDLNKRLTIQKDTATTQDGTGDIPPNWTEFCQRWAKVAQLSGTEQWRAQQVFPTSTHLIEMRWDKKANDITAEFRFKLGAKVFNILAVDNVDEANAVLRFTCMQAV